MSNRHAYSVIGAAVLSCAAVALAQTSPETHDQPTHEQQAATATIGEAADDMPIALVGCIQRESDYRKQHDAGRGGALATGLGLGNEYILVNASRAGSIAASAIDCSTASVGEAYELSGKAEADLEPFVGRMVEISGTLKHAGAGDDVVGTTGTTGARPSGGFDPLGQDLQLHEIDVMSFREVTAQAQITSQAAPEARAPEEQETQPVGTTGAAEPEEQAPSAEARDEQLPRTASPLPLAGLVGLLSLAGALGLRRARRRQ